MDESERQRAFITALTTEHFVLQTAASATIAEAGARSTLYVMALSSALVAMGFASQSPKVLVPFIATVLPAVFVLGLFTVSRLIDTTLENQQYLTGIARIRSYYRTLTPDAEKYLGADTGRWPEAATMPAMSQGAFIAFLGTTASMIAFLNNLVAGAAVTLGVDLLLGGDHMLVALAAGVVSAIGLMAIFMLYQRQRFLVMQQSLGIDPEQVADRP